MLDFAPGSVIFNEGGGDVDFRVEGVGAVNALFVQGSDGKVGIGTTSPDAKLRIDQDVGIVGLKVTGGSGGVNIAEFVRDVGATTSVTISGESGRPQMKFASAGNSFAVGVNSNTFEIADSTALGTNPRFSITNTGNVGIGTSSPTNTDYGSVIPKLHVKQAGTNGAFNLVARFEAGGDVEATGGAILINHSNDRGMLIEGGRDGSGSAADDDGVGHLGILTSSGAHTRMITLRQNMVGASSVYNVGIGTTAPAAKLDLRGDMRLDGSAGTDRSIYFRNQGTVGGQVKSDKNLSLWAGNGSGSATQYLTIKEGGNVGIGTTAPTHTLHTSTSATGVYIQREISSNAANLSEFNSHRSLIIKNRTGGSFLMFGGNGSRTDIQATDGAGTPTAKNIALNPFGGNVGIGTTSPAARLHISGNSDVSDEDCQLIIDDIDGSAGSRIPSIQFRSVTGGTTTNQGRIRATDTQGMILSGSSAQGDDLVVQAGKVGVGTTAPNQWASYTDSAATVLQVKDTSQRARVVINGGNGAHLDLVDYAGSANDKHMNIAVDAGVLKFGSLNDAGNAFVQNNIMVMDLGNGRVGIGTAALTNKFHVSGNARVEGNFMAGAASASNVPARPIHVKSSGDGAAIRIEDTTSSNTVFDFRVTHGEGLRFINVTGGITPLFVGTDGNVGIGTTSPDYKLDVTGPTGSYANGDLPIAVFQSSTDHRALVKVQNNNENDGASAPRAGFDLDVKDEASGNRIRSILALTKRTNGNAYGNTDLTVPYDFNIFVNNKGTITTSSGAQASSSVTAGDLAMSINASGNVGIGTTTPTSKLEVIVTQSNTMTDDTAAFAIKGNGGDGILMGQRATTPYAAWIAAGYLPNIGTSHNYPLTLQPHGGNVGIGNINPQTNLTIGSAQGNSLEFTYDSSNGYRNIISNHWDSSTDTRMDFNIGRTGNVAPVPVMSVGYGGNVGIGTTAPSYPLHIQTNDGTTNSTVGNILITNLSTGTTVPGFGGHIQFQAERNNGVNQNIGKIAFQSEVNAGTNISAGLRLYTSSAGTMTEKGRISWDGMWFVNGVRNYYQKITIVNNQSYTFDVPIQATASGHTVYYECMYNHFGNDTYGARRMGFFSFRSLSNSTSADHVVHNGGNSTNAGAWSVSMVGAGTSTPMMRFTKSAGSYGGTGQGYIHVRGGLPV